MNHVRRAFRCFRCHFFNEVIVPRYFRWKDCRRCHSKNYFNYDPNLRKRNYFQNNFNNNRNINNSSFDDDESDDEPFGFNNNYTFNECNNNLDINAMPNDYSQMVNNNYSY